MEGKETRDVGFFKFLSEEERAEFARVVEHTIFEPGEILIEEGGEPAGLLVLMSGQVEVNKRVPGRSDRLLAVLEPANGRAIVGERGLLSDSEASATVRAKGTVEAVKVPRERFRAMIRGGHPVAYKLAYHIARILAERVARLDEEVVEIAREIERRGETDLDAFRDKLLTEWTI